MEFADFMELVVPIVVETTDSQFDVRLARWLRDREIVPLQHRYVKWKEEPINLHTQQDNRLHHLLSTWQQEAGEIANPQTFLELIKTKKGTALLVDRLQQHLTEMESNSGIKCH